MGWTSDAYATKSLAASFGLVDDRGVQLGPAAHRARRGGRWIGGRAEPVADVPDAVEVADGPEQRALRIELTGEMGRMLDQLPDKQREILLLRVVVGLSAEETAQVVGSTPGAVRVTQHRALNRLRGVIGDPLEVDPEDPDDMPDSGASALPA